MIDVPPSSTRRMPAARGLVLALRLAVGLSLTLAVLFGAIDRAPDASETPRRALASAFRPADHEVPPGEMVTGWTDDDDETRSAPPALVSPSHSPFATWVAPACPRPGAPHRVVRRSSREIDRGPPAAA